MIKLKWPDGSTIKGVEIAKNRNDPTLDFYFDIDLDKDDRNEASPTEEMLEGFVALISNFPVNYDNFSRSKFVELAKCMAMTKPALDKLGIKNEFIINLNLALAVICYEDDQLNICDWTEEMSGRLNWAFQAIFELFIEVQNQHVSGNDQNLDQK